MVAHYKNDLTPPDALRALLKRLLVEGVVQAVLVPAVSPHSKLPMPTLIADADHVDQTVALAPVAPFNAARMAARVLAKDAGKRIAVVLRPCEVRALIELEKLSQCSRASALVISMDCYGRLENDRYLELTTETDQPEAVFLESRELQDQVCPSCGACIDFIPHHADLHVRLVGVTEKTGVTLESQSLAGEKILDNLEGISTSPPQDSQAMIDALMDKRQTQRQTLTSGAAKRLADMSLFQQTIADCLNCYNCRTACPVCYCKECVFLTDVFAHRPEILLGRASKKGAVKIPTDTTMFHMTRMAHIAHACVGCGQCSSVCPSHIPVADLFITVAEKVQGHYDYVPGQDPARPWPFLVLETDKQQASH